MKSCWQLTGKDASVYTTQDVLYNVTCSGIVNFSSGGILVEHSIVVVGLVFDGLTMACLRDTVVVAGEDFLLARGLLALVQRAQSNSNEDPFRFLLRTHCRRTRKG